MGGNLSKIISLTATLIMLYLIVKNASGTTSVIKSLGSVYTSGVKTLQGR